MQAHEIAAELRKLADHYEQFGEAELISPSLEFNLLGASKEQFLAVARTLPHPFEKDYGRESDPYAFAKLTFRGGIDVHAIAYRKTVCRVIKPAQEAVFECEPLLSEAEEAQIGGRQ